MSSERDQFRIKASSLVLSAEQLEALAEVARFGYPPVAHITTRGNVYIPQVEEKDHPQILNILSRARLGPMDAYARHSPYAWYCPRGGACPDQTFDVMPYYQAYMRYFDRYPPLQRLHKKFKIAFSGCASDCAVSVFSDLGFIATTQRVNGTVKQGFKVVLGGGILPRPATAGTLYEFVPMEDYLRVAAVVMQLLSAAPELERSYIAVRRAKTVVHLRGFDKFRQQVEEELKKEWAQKPIDLAAYMGEEEEEAPPPLDGNVPPAEPLPAEFAEWRAASALPLNRPGYHQVLVKLPMGNLTPDQLSALAQIVKEYARGALTATGQNIILRWVPEHALHPVWQALSQLGLAETGRDGITDVVGCSSEYCRLHITRALSAGQAIREALLSVDKELLDDPLINKMHIHIGGCPRACSQYAEGDIGFHGSVITVKGHHAPAYELFVGGSREPAHYRLAQAVGVKVVAKRAPEVVKRILDFYRAHRQVDETFPAFVDRVGVEPFKELAEPFAQLPPLSPETQDLYMDWEATEPFSVVVKRQKGWDAGS